MKLRIFFILLIFVNKSWGSECFIRGPAYDQSISIKEINTGHYAASMPKYLGKRIGTHLDLIYKSIDGIGENKYQSIESREHENMIYSNFNVSSPKGYYAYVQGYWEPPSFNECAAQGIKRIFQKSDIIDTLKKQKN